MTNILFVCIDNSARSQMAEAFFNKLARGTGKARSAGTKPAEHLDENVIEIMWEAGIEIGRQRPKLLTAKLLDWADKVITMGCGVEEVCPANLAVSEDWDIADPIDKPVEEVRRLRDEVRARVIDLLKEI